MCGGDLNHATHTQVRRSPRRATAPNAQAADAKAVPHRAPQWPRRCRTLNRNERISRVGGRWLRLSTPTSDILYYIIFSSSHRCNESFLRLVTAIFQLFQLRESFHLQENKKASGYTAAKSAKQRSGSCSVGIRSAAAG